MFLLLLSETAQVQLAAGEYERAQEAFDELLETAPPALRTSTVRKRSDLRFFLANIVQNPQKSSILSSQPF